MNMPLADALAEIYLSSLELLGASLRIIQASTPDGARTVDDLRVACVEAVVVARSFRDPSETVLLGERIGLTRDRFLWSCALLEALKPLHPSWGSSISASLEIAERGAEAAARAARTLEATSS